MLTQGEGKCQINNEDGPREAAEEATEIRPGILTVHRDRDACLCVSFCVCDVAVLDGLYIAVSHPCLSFHGALSNESKKADNILIFNIKDGS